jgi:nucleoporin GLE1
MPWDQIEDWHKQYLALHQRLKQLRQMLEREHKKALVAKKQTGIESPYQSMADGRRALAKSLGQITQDQRKNQIIMKDINETLLKAWQNTSKPLNAKDYMVIPRTPLSEGQPSQVSGIFIYLLNHFIKAGLKVASSAATNLTQNSMTPFATVLAFLISRPSFRVQGNSFIDVFLAKFHREAPAIFGIYGPENTAGGQKRLGWKEGDDAKSFYERFTGACLLYGAITLRGQIQNNADNVFKPWMHWSALACILNVPPAQLNTAHARALRFLLEHYVEQFLAANRTFGPMILKVAVIDLPKQAPAKSDWDSMKVMRANWEKSGVRISDNGEVWVNRTLLYRSPR